MKQSFSIALALGLVLALPAIAAEKRPKKPTGTPSTLPPKSPMIAVPPSDDAAPTKLISSEMSGQDLQFFASAVEAGRQQAYLVDLLKTRASSPEIKALAEALSSTQEEENKQIAKLAALKGWNVSTAPTATQKKAVADLEVLSGSNFDKSAMDKVISASRQAVSAYESAAQSTDKDIHNFAGQMLPLAQDKQRLVEKMTGVGNGAARQLFRAEPPAKAAAATPTPATPAAAKPAAATPKAAAVATPAAAATPKATATVPATTPKAAATVPAATPKATPPSISKITPTASVPPVATPPGATPPPVVRPAILPAKTGAPTSPAPIPPPVSQ